ncbi:helix-turn-helix domain-containing protein [Rhizobium sp. Rhizsp82]|uniref:helix-turn-helix domain-containing protein n=1 Tax=Rhizobium sp. Rhizsp82 TaxID=3243057 RepID=UPI0039B45C7F
MMSRQPIAKSEIDANVGARIRARRKLLGLSQGALAERLGITFQQVQKYEKGSNRVGSSRLQSIAIILGTTPAALFGEDPSASEVPELSLIERHLGSNENVALNKAFMKITDPGTRKAIISLIKSLAEGTEAVE